MDFRIITIVPAVLIFLGACSSWVQQAQKREEVQKIIDAVKAEYAPDTRVAVYDISVNTNEQPITLEGETNLPEAIATLKRKLSEAGFKFNNAIKVLPEQSLKDQISGVINISVANIRSNPAHSSQLVTQATMGTPVKVLKKEGNWYFIQTPDDYLGWVDAGGFTLMDEPAFNKWQKTSKIIFLKTSGTIYKTAEVSEIISDVVATNILRLEGEQNNYFAVRLPDGREGFVKKSAALPYEKWINQLNPTGKSLVNTARKFMGFPYLWGGTSPKGMDCSGFTKTVYFLNGMLLPRDASQQVNTGELIDTDKQFNDLAAGDLLFFGRKATDTTSERISHVGIWMGENREFIHAAASGDFQGKVVVSSFNKDAPNFDAHNLNRYVKTKRILNHADGNMVKLKKIDLF